MLSEVHLISELVCKYISGETRTQSERTQPTLQSDLPAGAVRSHAGLAGPLVGAVLQTNHRLTGLQDVIVEVPLVLTRHLQFSKIKKSLKTIAPRWEKH